MDPAPKRPPRRRITDREIAEALKASSGLAILAARKLGCAPDTIYSRLSAKPALRQIQLHAREEIVDLAEAGLKTCVMNRESWAIQFALRTIGRDRGYVEPSKYTVELTGAGGGPVKHEHSVQHMLQELAHDPAYVAYARQRAVTQQPVPSFARPVGLPAPDNVLNVVTPDHADLPDSTPDTCRPGSIIQALPS